MITMVEPVLELQMGVRLLDLSDFDHVLDRTTRRLLAKHVHATPQAFHRDGRGDVVPKAHEQYVQFLLQELLPVAPHPHPIVHLAGVSNGAVAYRYSLHARVSVD